MKTVQKLLMAVAVLGLLTAADAAYPLTIVPAKTDEAWVPITFEYNEGRRVFALAADSSGAVYAGGEITRIGNVAVKYIAKWDGATWSALGSGLNGTVYALAIDASGAVYVGGEFTRAGSVAVNYIAKWDGATWSALDTGLNGTVYALAIDASGAVYAGGGFTKGGDNTAVYNHIAKWDGATWSALGSGMGKTTTLWESVFGTGVWDMDCAVRALAIGPWGAVYAGGNFTEAGGVAANCIAKWNGRAWSALGLGMRKIYSLKEYNYGFRRGCNVYALAIDAAGTVYAGGNFTQAGVITARGIAKWNGLSWSTLGFGLRKTYNIGWYIFPYYNVWNPTVYSLAIGPWGAVYVGGSLIDLGGNTAYDIVKWNGLFWKAMGKGYRYQGQTNPVHSLALDAEGNLYRGGSGVKCLYR